MSNILCAFACNKNFSLCTIFRNPGLPLQLHTAKRRTLYLPYLGTVLYFAADKLLFIAVYILEPRLCAREYVACLSRRYVRKFRVSNINS